jgi:hypothetical protein
VRLLDFLPLRTLLSFRLLSSQTKSWVDSYPSLEKRLYKIRISIYEHNLSTFIEEAGSSFPFTNFAFISGSSVQNIGHSIGLYGLPEIPIFLELYGTRILRLFVPLMLKCQSQEEFRFFQSMTNLRTLEITSIASVANGIFDLKAEEEAAKGDYATARIPFACLTRLESLYLTKFPSSSSLNYYLDLMENSPRLRKLQLPIVLFQSRVLYYERGEGWKNAQERTKRVLIAYLNHRHKIGHDSNADLGLQIDMCSSEVVYAQPSDDDDTTTVTELEREFVRSIGNFACEGNNKIRFLHVPNEMLDYLAKCRHRQVGLSVMEIDNFFHSIVSVYGLSSEMRTVEMPHLEEIKCWSEDEESNLWIGGFSSGRDHWALASWPKLRKISVQLQPELCETDSYDAAVPFDGDKLEDLRGMMKFLFKKRRNVEELEVEVTDKGLTQQLVLTPDDFTKNFPNLKTLNLKIIGFNNEDVKRLVSLMPTSCKKLESLTLSVDFTLQEDTFLGRDETKDELYLLQMKCESNFDCRIH